VLQSAVDELTESKWQKMSVPKVNGYPKTGTTCRVVENGAGDAGSVAYERLDI